MFFSTGGRRLTRHTGFATPFSAPGSANTATTCLRGGEKLSGQITTVGDIFAANRTANVPNTLPVASTIPGEPNFHRKVSLATVIHQVGQDAIGQVHVIAGIAIGCLPCVTQHELAVAEGGIAGVVDHLTVGTADAVGG